LALKPSTTPLESWLLARNQFSKRSMAPQPAGDALHRPELRLHRAHAPSVQETPGQ
jgi:hypothetical protein